MTALHFISALVRYQLRRYLYNMAAFTVLMLGGLAPGWVFREFFAIIAPDEPARFGMWTLLVVLFAGTAARAWGLFGMLDANVPYSYANYTLLHKNLLTQIFRRPGASALPESPGAAMTRLRDDVDELPWFSLWFNNLIGYLAFMIVAVAIMASINLRLTLIAFLPLGIIVTVASLATERLDRYRRAARESSSSVTDFIAEIFGAVLSVKACRAEERVVDRMAHLNEERRKSSLMDRLLEEALMSVYTHAGNLGTGIILLLAIPAFRTQRFTVGDFALFVAYLSNMTAFFSFVGFMWARYKQVGVSIDRLQTLMVGAEEGALVAHGPVYLEGPLPPIPQPVPTSADRLESIVIRGLTRAFADTSDGIFAVDLTLSRGSFTVITGRIGAGKTTLLRCILGLLDIDRGTVSWNGKEVVDRSQFFVPPRCAYTAQVPRLFSMTLRENLLLGLDEKRFDLKQAIHSAVLEQDVSELEHGLETLVGPKGVKLSGGQIQRAAAARMLVRRPELLVFDDLSSALDVNTERILWERLFTLNPDGRRQGGPTCLVVSHRRAALQRADQIVILRDGRVEDVGELNELLDRSVEMKQIWEGGKIGG